MSDISGQPYRRIIVIDDNRAIHGDFAKILKRGDDDGLDDFHHELFGGEKVAASPVFDLEFASQGKQGYEKVVAARQQGKPFVLAFVDMRMPPGWDGVETVKQLWKVQPDLQIVICTAFSDYSWSKIIKELGQSVNLLILKKPFDSIEVSQLAAALTEKSRLSTQLQQRLTGLETLVKERTREIQQAHAESERFLSSISSLLIGLDRGGVIERWNSTAETMLGFPADRAIGTPLKSLSIDWHDRTKLFEIIEKRSCDESHRLEVSFCQFDGTSKVLELFFYQVCQDGQADGQLILGTDLTERHRLEQQLYQAQKLEAVGQLAAGVAHEINTPMQYIGDNVQYLKSAWSKLTPLLERLAQSQGDGASPDVLELPAESVTGLNLGRLLGMVPDAFDDTEDGIRHVSRIVRALKEFSHPGTEVRSSVDLNHALETTLVVAKNEWKYVAEIETQFDADLPMISGFPGELNQVFLNLLVNAAHAVSPTAAGGAQQKGLIKISTWSGDHTCTVMIADSGGGIPAAIADKVFDPFFTTKEVGKGTGQGLAIAHQVVVQKHGGRIWFDSEPGIGTTFYVELPRDDAKRTGSPALSEPVCV